MNVVTSNKNLSELIECSEELSVKGHIAYAYCSSLGPHGEGPCKFALDNPKDIEQLSTETLPNFASGGTWTSDNRWLVCEYSNGALYEIDTEDGEITYIGGGGYGDERLNGLAWDYITYGLYGTSGSDLYEIDPEDGSQTLIGSHSITTGMNGITCDNEGTCFGVDIDYSRETYSNLYTIDISTGEATLVAPLINCSYAMDAAYNKDNETLYLMGNGLFICDTETGECTRVGTWTPELTGFAIPEINLLPIAEFHWKPILPEPGEEILFNASDSYDPDGYIKLYEWDWDNDGEFDEKNYTSPFTTHIFEESGYYPVSLRVTDNCFTNDTITIIVRVGNQPPDPPIITGPIQGNVGVEYGYNFLLSDPNNDSMYLRVDWGNGTAGPWQGLYDSDTNVKLNHTWSEKGNYIIKAQTKDIFDAESEWGTLEVIIPKNKLTQSVLFRDLFKWFKIPFLTLKIIFSFINSNNFIYERR